MKILLVICLLSWAVSTPAETVYRYQDESGRWHFSDRKPKQSHETLEMVHGETRPEVPEFVWRKTLEGNVLTAVNPLYCPVEFDLLENGKRIQQWVVEPRSQFKLVLNGKPIVEWRDGFEYRFRLGRPLVEKGGYVLHPPIPQQGKFLVTQGFRGHFSHKEEPNLYAIDIAMAISEHIHAAKEGVVIGVKDDYHLGGTDKFFLDKANYIMVWHSDNTYAVYAHILLGSAFVKVGQRVEAGQPLANAGTSGYSTGPHLHFVLRANDGDQTVSLPFKFTTAHGVVKPIAKSWLKMPESH